MSLCHSAYMEPVSLLSILCVEYPSRRQAMTLCTMQDPVTGVCFDDILILDTKIWRWSAVEVGNAESFPPSIAGNALQIGTYLKPHRNDANGLYQPDCRWRVASHQQDTHTALAFLRAYAWYVLIIFRDPSFSAEFSKPEPAAGASHEASHGDWQPL